MKSIYTLVRALKFKILYTFIGCDVSSLAGSSSDSHTDTAKSKNLLAKINEPLLHYYSLSWVIVWGIFTAWLCRRLAVYTGLAPRGGHEGAAPQPDLPAPSVKMNVTNICVSVQAYLEKKKEKKGKVSGEISQGSWVFKTHCQDFTSRG